MSSWTSAGVPIPRFQAARTEEEAEKAAEATGYPVVMKVISPGYHPQERLPGGHHGDRICQ